MQYTENYHLPQWVKEDRIMMDDFNDAMAAMEEGMSSAANTANAAASTANAAQTLAQQTAGKAYTPENKPYVNGWYRGLGTSSVTINVGFKPMLVLIFTNQGMASPYNYFSAAGRLTDNERVTMTDTGFQLAPANDRHPWPSVNEKDFIYEYFAFQ